MADFKLQAEIILSQVKIASAVRKQLKNIKVDIDDKKIGAVAKSLGNVHDKSMLASKGMKKVSRDARKAASSFNKAEKKGDDMAKMFEVIGRRALAFRVAATFINLFTDSIADAVSFIREFDQAMADIQKITKASRKQLEGMGEQLITIATQYGLAADEVIGEFKIIVQAGFKAEEAFRLVGLAAQGAAATTLNFAQATEILIQSMSLFGKQETDVIFDKIAVAESVAAVTASDIQSAMKRSAGTFREVNASVDDMIGLISALQEVSRRGGAVIGTAFRTINTRIVAGDTKKAVEDLGVVIADQHGNLRRLVDIYGDISIAFKGLTEEQRVQAATTIAGRRQFESFIQILNSLDKAQIIATETQRSQGEAAERAAIQAETLNGILNQLRNTFLETVKEVEGFIPLVDVFKAMTQSLIGLMKVGDGAIAKMAALGALILGFKAMVPVFKGLGKAVGGFGNLIPALAFAGGGFGITGSQKKQEPSRRFGRAGSIGKQEAMQQYGFTAAGGVAGGKTDLTKTNKLRGRMKMLNERFKGLNVASFALGATLSGLSSKVDGVGGKMLEFGGTMASAFAFGPVIGSIVTVTSVFSELIPALLEAEDAGIAYSKSMKEFGDKTLADTEAALTGAKASGDEYAQTVIAQDIAFRKVSISLYKGLGEVSGQADKFAQGMEKVIETYKKLAPGTVIQRGELLNKTIAELVKAGFSKDIAANIATDKKLFGELLEAGKDTTMDLRDVVIKNFSELADHINKELGFLIKQKEKIDLSDIFSDEKFFKSQSEVTRLLEQAAFAEDLFARGIEDSIEIRKRQAVFELDTAQKIRDEQKQAFERSLSVFKDIKGIDVVPDDVFGDLFQNLTRGGKGMAPISEIEEKFAQTFTEFGFDINKSEDSVKEAFQKFIGDFFTLEKGLIQYRKSVKGLSRDVDKANLDEMIKGIDGANKARDREIEQVERLKQILEGLQIPEGDVSGAFAGLQEMLSGKKIDSDAMLKFLGAVDNSVNPLQKARQAIDQAASSNLDRIGALRESNKEYEDQIKELNTAAPSQERVTKALALNNLIVSNKDKIEVLQAKTLKNVVNKTKLLQAEQKKTLQAQNDLVSSLSELSDSLEAAAQSSYASAQEDLNSTQEQIISSTEALADAYEDLKNAQLELGNAIADYRVGMSMAAREADIITGRIRGFSAQMSSIQTVYDEILNSTRMTETQRLELLRESASAQLDLVQNVIDETKSIGQRLFTADAAEGSSLVRGFAAIREVIGQFQGGGGFGGVDLNQFGNTLLQLPQSLREEMVKALGMLPETATLGGMSKEEIQSILFGSAVGESQEANIQNINDLTEQQLELMTRVAELNTVGIITANEQLEEARKQSAAAEAQLAFDQIMMDRSEQNFDSVTAEIQKAAVEVRAVQMDASMLVADTFSNALSNTNKMNLSVRASEHAARLSALQSIDVNTEAFARALEAWQARVIPTGYAGHVPRNFAAGNASELAGLVRAYRTEKRMGPPGSRPVVANDSEIIIPTRSRGNVPNYQDGNLEVDMSSVEDILNRILEEMQVQATNVNDVAAVGPEPIIEANINVNSEQTIQLTGATSIANAVATAVRNQLSGFMTEDQMGSITETMTEMFDVLKQRGLMNSIGASR